MGQRGLFTGYAKKRDHPSEDLFSAPYDLIPWLTPCPAPADHQKRSVPCYITGQACHFGEGCTPPVFAAPFLGISLFPLAVAMELSVGERFGRSSSPDENFPSWPWKGGLRQRRRPSGIWSAVRQQPKRQQVPRDEQV